MIIFPAIDIIGGKAVRLFQGDYNAMTVYNDNPVSVAQDFRAAGATAIHLVDLEGAKSGGTPNFETVVAIKRQSGLFCEIGGGIRSMDVIERYLGAGIDRVILGTAALNDEAFLKEALAAYADKISVGVDMKAGFVAVKGWTEVSDMPADVFCKKMQALGVKHLICTDISKDGAMQGTNRALYKTLSQALCLDITASGGVSTLEDIRELAAMQLYGAIIGKAYYTGAINLQQAIEVANGN
ncbi:MAG: 1-(5-phosphoribosyl)-5-[(5-phosphoribosylamino)methylideneamino]imidazole-4-carboxamide isomerase [Ruminococcaceae bacterium]|nr:1-(5-phosphoribosyl)-5-[(5-phosphoribosylamino)methylideneamino]imidazole-4-carboxamide isomerase [Oscillospiraceae bacterium]